MSMTLDAALSGFVLTALLYAGFVAHLLRRWGWAGRRSGPAYSCLLGASITSAAWSAAEAAFQVSELRAVAGLAVALDLLRYAFWFGFALALLQPEAAAQEARTRGGLVRMAWALLAAALAARVGAVLLPEFGAALIRPLLASSLALAVFGLVLVEQVFRGQSESGQWNAKLVCLAMGVGFLFDLFLHAEAVMFGRFDSGTLEARGLVHAIAVPLLVVASRRHDSWIEKMRVSRAAAFYSATLLLAGGYLVFVAAAGYYVRYVGGSWGRALQITLLFGAGLLLLLLLLLSGTLRSRLRVFLGKHFFRYRYDYRQEWLRFTARLSASGSPNEIGSSVIQALADLVESPGGSLWSRGIDGDQFVQAARWNAPAIAEREPKSSSLCRFMLERDWVVDLAEFRNQPRRYGELVLPLWLTTSPSTWLVIPLVVAEELTGFVVLMTPRTAFDLNWEVRDLLKTAARQAAAFLAHTHATEALLESRKLDAFHRMSAFVVHDLKNIVTQLSLMMKNAERHSDNPEFQQDMILTVQHSLEKMRQMILQLREGQAPAGGSPGVDLAAVLMRVGASARQGSREVELEVIDRIATRGDETRLERVIGHVVQNALDATPPSGQVAVRLYRDAGRAVVEVRDTGVGMTPEFVQNRLYRPFNTTKTTGMGIGAYESHQYLKELGGSIDVFSEVGRGTTVRMFMPLMPT